MMCGAPRGSPCKGAALGLRKAVAADSEEASALEEELTMALALMLQRALLMELVLVVALAELVYPYGPLEASQRSPSTRASSAL